MSEFTEKPYHRLSRNNDGMRIVENRQRLRSKPKHFFSNNFSLEIEDEPTTHYETDPNSRLNRLGRFIDLNLAFLILVVGVPILVYCVISSSL
ncbi:hypothetical protein [Sphingomonas sp. Leaf38]|jgi:hypothetical protein|uniref:hypothetical protein n=1 Tax=Sphingomonas sp. Leaf38 TaxID=1736217 RepID=UPI0012E1310A|nr:hypothetical protein [Sphingomonas sp. Leaf38]